MLPHSESPSDDQLCTLLLDMFPSDAEPGARVLPNRLARLAESVGLANRGNYERAVSVAKQRGFVEEQDPRAGDMYTLMLTAAGQAAK